MLSNWRRISLIKVDNKIATKALPNRLKKILPNIINKDRSGFMKGRYICENVRLIVIKHLGDKQLPGIKFFSDS